MGAFAEVDSQMIAHIDTPKAVLPSKKGDKMRRKGFTIIEVLVGASIMLMVIMLTLTLYTKSNKVAVDQMQLAVTHHDVRSAMLFISRDIRSTGVGLAINSGYSMEGIDGYGPGPEFSDAINLMGCFDDPLNLTIEKYQGGTGGAAATAFLYDWELETMPYPPEYYTGKTVMIVSTTCPGCFAVRSITQVFGLDGTGVAKLSMVPGLAVPNPPGGLSDTGCPVDCWKDGVVTFGDIMFYWVDTSGIPADYPDLNLTVWIDGYSGVPNTLYMTVTGGHMAIAQNIENLQLQYLGDLDYDGLLDPSVDWDNANWTIGLADDVAVRLGKLGLISRIRGVRIWVLGKTKDPFVSRSGGVPVETHVYRRPAIANSPASSQDDNHRRFLVETTSNVRNHCLDLYPEYNSGLRVRSIKEVRK